MKHKMSRPRWSADPEVLERIEAYTKPRNMSLSAFLRSAVNKYLSDVEPSGLKQTTPLEQ